MAKNPVLAFGSNEPDRLSHANPGATIPSGPIRGMFLAMLERFPLPTFRGFWRSHPMVHEGRTLSEAEGYRHLWEGNLGITQAYAEEIECSVEAFLWAQGISLSDFVDAGYLRFQQGGNWKSSESLAWIKDFLPKLYSDPEPLMTLELALCNWGMQAVPGASCQLPYLRRDAEWIESVFSFAPDAAFGIRCLHPFSQTVLYFMRHFPTFFGLPAFEKAELLGHCFHPDHILWGAPWEIQGETFLIDKHPYGKVVKFSEWSLGQSLRFQGPPVPDRDVILMDKDYHCLIRNRTVLQKNCIYNAPIFLASIGFSRKSDLHRFGESADYLRFILNGLTRDDSEAWQRLEASYRELISAAEEKLAFEYRPVPQALFIDGKTLISGVPAKIFRKILIANGKGQRSFDFRAFKYDQEIFPSAKDSSFETRWNRLREKLMEATSRARLERTGKGEFVFEADCPIEFHEVG